MAPETQQTGDSRVSSVRYDQVETSYDPGQLLASDDAPNNTSVPDPSTGRAKKRHGVDQDYKPTALRWWFHCALIASLAALIGLTEYTIRTLQVYYGYDSVAHLWSRDDNLSYQIAGRKATSRDKHFQRIQGASESEITTIYITPLSAFSTEIPAIEIGFDPDPAAYLSAGTGMTLTTTTTPATKDGHDDVRIATTTTGSPTTLPQRQRPPDTGIVSTAGSPIPPTTAEADTTAAKATTISISGKASEDSSTPIGKVTSSSAGIEATIVPFTTTNTEQMTTFLTSKTSAYMQIGPTTSTRIVTETTTTSDGDAASQIGTITSKSSSLESTLAVLNITANPEPEATLTPDATAYMQVTPIASTITAIDFGGGGNMDPNAYLQDGSTTSTRINTETKTTSDNHAALQMSITTPKSSSIESTVEVSTITADTELKTTLSTSDTSAYMQVGPTTATSDGNAVLQTGTTISRSSNIESTMAGIIVTPNTEPETTLNPDTVSFIIFVPASSPEVDAPSKTTSKPSDSASALSASSSKYLVVGPTPTTEAMRVASDIPSPVFGNKETGGTSRSMLGPIFTTDIQGITAGETPTVTVAEGTKAWAPTETTIVQTTVDSVGLSTVKTEKTTLSGSTSIYQSTMEVSSESHQVTVIQQTETWSPSEKIIEQTVTKANGDIVMQTLTTTSPGGTSVVQSAVSLLSGETLVTIPTVVPTTIGASTAIIQTIFSDTEGHTALSSYTAVLGGMPTFTTRTYFVATSLPLEDTVLTVPTVVPTVIGGTAKVQQAIYTDSHGALATSSYTAILGGIPTSATISIVIATPVPSGEVLVTRSTVKPTTIGGTTEVAHTTFTNAQGQITTSAYTTVLHGTPTSMTEWTIVPTPTSGSANTSSNDPDSNGGIETTVYGLGNKDYLLGTFLPTFLAVLVAYPVKLISINARLMQPFHLLATADEIHGAALKSSVYLRFDSWLGALSLPRSISWRQPVIAISDLLVLGAALLPPIAAEAISVHVPNGCHSHCFGNLGVSIVLGRTLEALMATMAALLVALILLLSVRRWRTGVRQNPWSIAGMASLCSNTDIRDKMRPIPRGLSGGVEDSAIIKALEANTGFERFMDSQGFGVGFLFTALGVALGTCMESVFRSVAIMSPYLQLSSKRLPAERSILLSPPTNAFYGIYSAARQRNLFLGVVSFTTVLGELCLPVTLSLVPFSLLETYKTQLVCAWLSISILCLMILVLVSSFFITWPHMPVDPRTVAGAMFYVCDSWMLETLQGMSTMGKKDRDLDVKYLRLRYGYGRIKGAVSQEERMGVDVCDDTGEEVS
ncbi:hypothetical protein VPNG_09763 [Cytospora leucostoma]|uniref:Uncharacterized protein n=1 Tax=Cytospora leucostoma TaxID=1230097 RepID=A0A423VLR9_9PEZI|nr:hypothetical protein VPNG_09763 [Cytospora leucostoma]